MKIKAEYKNNILSVIHDGEVIRTITEPKHKGVYRFRVNNEQFFLLFEDFNIRGNRICRIFLYPLNVFKNNEINLL